MQPAEYAKAIVGAAIAGVTVLGTALADGAVVAQEWIGIVLAVLGTFGGVYQVPNRPPRGSRLHRQAGRVDLLYALLCILVGLLVIAAFLWLFDPRG